MLKFRIIALFCIALLTTAQAVVNFPFPQNVKYAQGLVYTADPVKIQTMFNSWWTLFYEENSTKTQARIKWDTQTETVSEGIGYGMLLSVYMSSATRSYESEFKKLWAYYKNFSNSNGVMNWRITGFTNVHPDGKNGATDAELDVAAALVMAYYQFGDASYLQDAKTLIAAIRSKEVTSSNLLKPGDAWEDRFNPSYSSTAALQLFDNIGASTGWTSIISAVYSMIEKNQAKSSVGLPSDWCNADGSQVPHWDGLIRFGYDAARTPWRMQWAYYWYGHPKAKSINTKIASVVSGLTPGKAKGPVQMNGTFGSHTNATFVGAFANALASTSNTAQFDEYNSYMYNYLGADTRSYYNGSLRLIYALLLSGNMPDLSQSGAGTPVNPPDPTDPTDPDPTDPDPTDPSEPTENTAPCPAVSGLGKWETYADAYGSKTTPSKGSNPVVNSGGYNIAKTSMSIVKEADPIFPWVGMLVNFDEGGQRYDLSAVSSIQLTYQSTGTIRFNLLQQGITGTGGEYGVDLEPSSSWRTRTIYKNELAQPPWVAQYRPDLIKNLDMSSILGAKFDLKDYSKNGTSGSISVKELVFSGFTPPTVMCAVSSPVLPKPARNLTGIKTAYYLNTLHLVTPTPGIYEVEVFDLQGRSRLRIPKVDLQAGNHSLGQLESGIHWVNIRRNGQAIHSSRIVTP